jgi:hypothetical protein
MRSMLSWLFRRPISFERRFSIVSVDCTLPRWLARSLSIISGDGRHPLRGIDSVPHFEFCGRIHHVGQKAVSMYVNLDNVTEHAD